MVRPRNGTPTLITRGGHDWTYRLKDLLKSLAALPVDTARLNGEVVVLNSAGLPDFNALLRTTTTHGPSRSPVLPDTRPVRSA